MRVLIAASGVSLRIAAFKASLTVIGYLRG
jgi:hypothetical protein